MQEATCDIEESEVLAQMPRNQEEEGLSDAQHPGIRVGEFVTQTDTSITRDVLQPKNKTERELQTLLKTARQQEVSHLFMRSECTFLRLRISKAQPIREIPPPAVPPSAMSA